MFAVTLFGWDVGYAYPDDLYDGILGKYCAYAEI